MKSTVVQYRGRPEPLMKLLDGFLVNSIQGLHKKQVCHYVVYHKLWHAFLRYFTAVVLLAFPEKIWLWTFIAAWKCPPPFFLYYISFLHCLPKSQLVRLSEQSWHVFGSYLFATDLCTAESPSIFFFLYVVSLFLVQNLATASHQLLLGYTIAMLCFLTYRFFVT